jgi:hypothetical protein
MVELENAVGGELQQYRDELARQLWLEPIRTLAGFMQANERATLRYKLSKAERRALLNGIDFDSEPLRLQTELVGSHISDMADFPVSNESRLHAAFPLIKDSRGGVFGVGSDQVFDILANTDTNSAWMFDIAKPNVLTMRALLEVGPYHKKAFGRSPKPPEFFEYFQDENLDELWRILMMNMRRSDLNSISSLTEGSREPVFSGHMSYASYMFHRSQLTNNEGKPYAWYSTPDKLDKVISSYQEGRIFTVNGDLKDSVVMDKTAQAARSKGTEFGVIYLSNVEALLGSILLPHQLSQDLLRAWRNIHSLPISDDGVILRTARAASRNLPTDPDDSVPLGCSSRNAWHYNIETWKHHQIQTDKNPRYGNFGWIDEIHNARTPDKPFISYLA